MKKSRIVSLVIFLGMIFILATGCSTANNSSSGTVSNIQSNEESEAQNSNELTIYFVRHGKTWFNTTHQVQGFSDSPLTEVGIEQAKLVGAGMADIEFVTAFSSDLGRQRSTAKLILSENANEIPELVELYGLREWNFGGFEGRPDEEMWSEEIWKPIVEAKGITFDDEWKWQDEIGNGGLADGIKTADPLGAAEGYQEILERTQKAMVEIINSSLEAGGGNVLIVSSGGVIPTILTTIVPEQYNGEDINNCSVTTLTYKDGIYTLVSVGDTSYIE